MQQQPLKVAVVQAAPAFLDLDAGVDKSITLIAQAAASGARLIAFPETWLPGYPFWIWLGTPAWSISRGFVNRYFDNSLRYDSPQAERLRQAARQSGMYVVMGLSERAGSSLYIAQWIIGPDGQDIARRRKLKPTHVERTVFGDGDGSDQSVAQVVMGYFGVQSTGPENHGRACRALMGIVAGLKGADGAGHIDLTHYVDAQGYDNMIAIAYWDSPHAFTRWRDSEAIAAWWNDPQRLQDGLGYFREILSPRIQHVETMFNTPDHPEGVGMVMGGLSEPFREHGYWGSMRERILGHDQQ